MFSFLTVHFRSMGLSPRLDGCEHGARLDQVGSYLSCRVMVPTGLEPSAARKRCTGSHEAAPARCAGAQRSGRREHGAMLDGSGESISSQGIQGVSTPFIKRLTAGRKSHLAKSLIVRRQLPLIARRGVHHCASLHVELRIRPTLVCRSTCCRNYMPPMIREKQTRGLISRPCRTLNPCCNCSKNLASARRKYPLYRSRNSGFIFCACS